MRYIWLAVVVMLSTNAMAENRDYSFFVDSQDRLCMEKSKFFINVFGVDAAEDVCHGITESVRIRIVDAPVDESSLAGVYLERPFMIIDGINLDPVEKKTLTDLEGEVQQVGLPKILKSLGQHHTWKASILQQLAFVMV